MRDHCRARPLDALRRHRQLPMSVPPSSVRGSLTRTTERHPPAPRPSIDFGAAGDVSIETFALASQARASAARSSRPTRSASAYASVANRCTSATFSARTRSARLTRSRHVSSRHSQAGEPMLHRTPPWLTPLTRLKITAATSSCSSAGDSVRPVRVPIDPAIAMPSRSNAPRPRGRRP